VLRLILASLVRAIDTHTHTHTQRDVTRKKSNPRRWMHSKLTFLFTGLASKTYYCGQYVRSNNSKKTVLVIFKFRFKLKISLVVLSLPVRIPGVKMALILSDMNIRKRGALPLCLVFPFRRALSYGCCKRIFSPPFLTLSRGQNILTCIK
jgi:hypothetical protein